MSVADDGSRTFAPRIIGIGGTLRPGSTSERAVIMALRCCTRLGATTQLFDGPFISRLPLYAPGRAERSSEEHLFIRSVRECDGIIISSPGYHGCVSGPIKNVLDLLEDTARDARQYLDGRAFGCVVTAQGWQACGTTLVSLRLIAHALRAWPTPFGAALNTSTALFDGDGNCLDEKILSQLDAVASQVVEFAHWRAAGSKLKTNDLIAS